MDAAEASFHGPITLNHSVAVTAPAGGSANFAGAIAGGIEAMLTKLDAGTVVLSASNSFSGAIQVEAGQLAARDAGALGAGTSLYLGTMTGGVAATLTLDGDIPVTRNVRVRAGGASTLSAVNAPAGAAVGAVNLENFLTVDIHAGSLLRIAGHVGASTPTAGNHENGRRHTGIDRSQHL